VPFLNKRSRGQSDIKSSGKPLECKQQEQCLSLNRNPQTLLSLLHPAHRARLPLRQLPSPVLSRVRSRVRSRVQCTPRHKNPPKKDTSTSSFSDRNGLRTIEAKIRIPSAGLSVNAISGLYRSSSLRQRLSIRGVGGQAVREGQKEEEKLGRSCSDSFGRRSRRRRMLS
jgi:hypothetical protein